MNEMEIDEAVDIFRYHRPEHYPYAKFLQDWKDAVNDSSDGWAYCKRAYTPAKALSALVKQSMDALRGHGTAPEVADMEKALKPIRSAAKRLDIPCPELESEPSVGYGSRGF